MIEYQPPNELFVSQMEANKVQPSRIKILTWNIQNPSIQRAERQVEWLSKIDANIIILTEGRVSRGCQFLNDQLQCRGFTVMFPKPQINDYCVIMAIKDIGCRELKLKVDFLRHRVLSVACDSSIGRMTILGLYVPSRGPKEKRNMNKRKFQDEVSSLIGSLVQGKQIDNLVIGGDLNVLERTHIPRYSVFGEWEYEFYESFVRSGLTDAYRLLHPDSLEYSWFGRKGNGYRFDHFFVSQSLSKLIINCSYMHIARHLNLSDHSAMLLEVTNISSE